MRTIILAALAATTALIPAGASAQSGAEVRQGNREVYRDRQDVQDARGTGRDNVRDAKQELHEDQRERNEDWRDYKRTHASVYRRPAYVGPAGYRYRPVTVGYKFTPVYYSSKYIITNYSVYRLPAPRYSYQRWVRYGNDVVLIDTRYGTVVVVHNGFFS